MNIKTIVNILIFGGQCLAAFMTTFVVSITYSLFNYQGGFAEFVGFTIFQPIFAIVFASLTVAGNLIIGIPIRRNKRINNWWTARLYVPLILFVIGLVFIILSLSSPFIEVLTYRMDGMDRTDTVPNRFFSITGWFLTNFAVLHTFPPRLIMTFIYSLLGIDESELSTEK
jgi:hypothetical protein